MDILVLNAGSSTLKTALFRLPAGELVWEGFIDWVQAEQKTKTYPEAHVHKIIFDKETDRHTVIRGLFQGLDISKIGCVGHRVVHGGDRYHQAVFLTPEVVQTIADLAHFAPIHNPAALEGIKQITAILGEHIPQVAVFDTAFHAHLPLTAALYPIPYKYFTQGIRKYGFHGTSHRYVAQQTAQLLGRDLSELKLITCHLGNGCSLAAIADGHSIDTTMGFTPLAGLMMGTRSGDIDPSILIHLGRTEGLSFEQLDRLLNRESGLLGVSGISSDLRAILQAKAEGNPRAKLAYDVFIHRLRACLGSMLASLGGLDGIVFTGGIGENSPLVRADALANFRFLGIELDMERNQSTIATNQIISSPTSAIQVFVIHTQEDRAIAGECWQLLHQES
ncbi:MAG: acetate/propionate family kinase [Pseudanabaenaceae cyanobacterium]